jgi:tRNA-specific 2-thiouridylase
MRCHNIKQYNATLLVKIRTTGPILKTNIFFDNDLIKIKLDKKESGISPGQACVFYSKTSIGDKVLGGGWIDSNN